MQVERIAGQGAANSIFSYYNQPNSKSNNNLSKSTMSKTEDKLMDELNEQIRQITENDEMDEKIKKSKIEAIKEQIEQITEAKRQRELEALQRNVKDKENTDKKAEEEERGIFSTSDYKAMVDITISKEKITVMKQAKTRLAAEQSMLSREIDADAQFKGYVSNFKKNLNSKEKSGVEGLEHGIRLEEIEIAKTNRAHVKAKNEETKNRRLSGKAGEDDVDIRESDGAKEAELSEPVKDSESDSVANETMQGIDLQV